MGNSSPTIRQGSIKVALHSPQAYLVRAITQANVAREALISACDNLSCAGALDSAELLGSAIDKLEECLKSVVKEHEQN